MKRNSSLEWVVGGLECVGGGGGGGLHRVGYLAIYTMHDSYNLSVASLTTKSGGGSVCVCVCVCVCLQHCYEFLLNMHNNVSYFSMFQCLLIASISRLFCLQGMYQLYVCVLCVRQSLLHTHTR